MLSKRKINTSPWSHSGRWASLWWRGFVEMGVFTLTRNSDVVIRWRSGIHVDKAKYRIQRSCTHHTCRVKGTPFILRFTVTFLTLPLHRFSCCQHVILSLLSHISTKKLN